MHERRNFFSHIEKHFSNELLPIVRPKSFRAGLVMMFAVLLAPQFLAAPLRAETLLCAAVTN